MLNGNKSKEEILAGIHMSEKDLKKKQSMSLRMAASYLRDAAESISCQIGDHEWDNGNNLCGNVHEIQEMGDEVFTYRKCRHCGEEMPESRDYFKKRIKESNVKKVIPNHVV